VVRNSHLTNICALIFWLVSGCNVTVMRQDNEVTVPHDHAVTFYDHDGEAIGALARFVVDGLSAAERVIVIATEWHLAVLADLLKLRGIDVGRERSSGHYLTLDASETLSLFMVKASPERELFTEHIGELVEAAGRDGTAVRAFGEMVALLWDDGNIAAALELEALWNELAQTHAFDLLCAYPIRALDSATLANIHSVCGQHSDVGAPLRYTAMPDYSSSIGDGRTSEVFLPVTESVVAARNFVSGVLENRGEDQLVRDAASMTSELATHAAVTENSPFIVVVTHAAGVVRIAVEYVPPGRSRLRTPTRDDTQGHGLPVVEDLAWRWGCDRAGEGKVVWAELVSTLS
jgi:hypothetical protein